MRFNKFSVPKRGQSATRLKTATTKEIKSCLKMSQHRFIFVSVDGSEHSDRAFDWYLQNMRQKGDKIGIVNVIEPPSVPATFMMMGPVVVPEEWNAEIQDCLDKSKLVTKKFEKRCEENGLEHTVLTESACTIGGPGETICQLARENHANGIIMGSRGLSAFRRAFIGSVSSYVVGHSPVPVIITPPKSSKDE